MISDHQRRSARAVVDRYAVETAILTDDSLASWFLDVCLVDTPSFEPPVATTASFERVGFVTRVGAGWILGPEGRRFAEDLGIALAPDRQGTKDAELGEIAQHTWDAYQRTRSPVFQNQVIENSLHLVRHHTDRLASKLPRDFGTDELAAAGVLGLLDAVEGFGGSYREFLTRADRLIRAAMLARLRQHDWLPALVRTRAARLQATVDQMRAELARLPTLDEVATRLKISQQDLREMVKSARLAITIADDNAPAATPPRKAEAEAAQRAVQRRELQRQITDGLSRTERLVILLYYYEELTVREIAAVLEMTAESVATLHESILWKIRAAMRSLPSVLEAIGA
ncbi:MAG TPA: sigma-70 family RNA polymerase sigma factor [Tepidisphaeraceae bacterium]|nr:sigma-70 family RNA polymerase sigma factor [Tepidisphaeraceae bacterium]